MKLHNSTTITATHVQVKTVRFLVS